MEVAIWSVFVKEICQMHFPWKKNGFFCIPSVTQLQEGRTVKHLVIASFLLKNFCFSGSQNSK